LEKLEGDTATFNLGQAKLKLRGAHNAFNATGALALTQEILGDEFDSEKMLKTLSEIKPAFGRGESFHVHGAPVELILVKNPSGFRIVLGSQYNPKTSTMIAINDQYADGRDVSWLWDVDLRVMKNVAMVSGVRAYDMALRLSCQNIEIGRVEPDLTVALADFLNSNPGQPKQIFTTYTAMLHMRKILKKEYMK
jgi:UDP-N-acetylmuramyl tripeptide synthase